MYMRQELVHAWLHGPCLVPKSFPKKCYSSHHVESCDVHGALNVDEKKLITQFGWKSRDERFEPN